ncbi:MAG: MOSC N-terminal beta barrel domain-containing protein [Burkholderiales bacterium]|uniref:MOSC domain-containing protein n=1 Tax=Ottowia sp. TaxID=1898956 RepID=UPI001AC62CE3|nr:MOSC N-terminal beta barrel domain-containing protein [Ottowia sp.]MBN9405856.1 MOSC N-terminal beta barrel domain-containing protein [Burkholderiales bacterium]MBS0401396.1 MOSC N-terminal beta barrel domain-containing protein [Pseudomonadota bacterium]
MQQPEPDVRARVARLFVYPVKSCAGVELGEALLAETGLDLDRAWMVVDGEGQFLTQREWPRMALVRPQIRLSEVVLRAPGMLALHLGIDEVERPLHVRVWNDELDAWDMGDIAGQWFSDFLGQPGLRLARFDPEVRRLSNLKWTGGIEAVNQFVDGYPFLVTSEASLAELNRRLQAAGHAPVGIERLRPNLVLAGVEPHDEDRLAQLRIATADGPVVLKPVKPCARCPIPNIDPQTAQSSPEVLATLSQYRADARVDGQLTFGMNAIILGGVERTLRVGDAVEGDWLFD